MKRARLVLGALLAVVWSGPARASGPIGVGTPIDAPPTVGLEPGNKRAYWSRGEHRPFVSSILDAGYLYVRPSIAVGFGKPHWRFVQLETSTALSANGAGQFGGLRLAIPYAELRGGLRAQLPFTRTFLVSKASHSRFDLEDRDAPGARYLSIDADLLATVPAFHGSVFALFGGYRLSGVDEGYDVYEELLRVIARNGWILRARLGYAFRLGEQGAVRIGPVVEGLYIHGRDARVIRVGLVATVVLTHNVEVLASFIPTVVSPDAIGVAGGDFGQLGVRIRWGAPATPHTEEEDKKLDVPRPMSF